MRLSIQKKDNNFSVLSLQCTEAGLMIANCFACLNVAVCVNAVRGKAGVRIVNEIKSKIPKTPSASGCLCR